MTIQVWMTVCLSLPTMYLASFLLSAGMFQPPWNRWTGYAIQKMDEWMYTNKREHTEYNLGFLQGANHAE